MLLRSGSFMVGVNNNKRQNKKVSMQLMASLAPARAEVEAGVVAKSDQLLYSFICKFCLYFYDFRSMQGFHPVWTKFSQKFVLGLSKGEAEQSTATQPNHLILIIWALVVLRY